MTGADGEALYARVTARRRARGVSQELAGRPSAAIWGKAARRARGGLSHLADKRHDQVIGTLLKLSRLPRGRPTSRGSTSAASAATPRAAPLRRF